MRITTNPVRAFAEKVYASLGRLEYETTKNGKVIAKDRLKCNVDNREALKTIWFLYECGEVICFSRPLYDETDRRENETIVFEAIEQEEAEAHDECQMPGELYETEVFQKILGAIEQVTGIHEAAA